MKKCLLIIFIAILSSCNQPVISRSAYEQIQIGAPVEILDNSIGSPYEIRRNQDGSETYEYIERIEIGPRTTDQTSYYIRIKDGYVVDKDVSVAKRPYNISTP